MKPGRELDALVAEKVMGWRRMSYLEAKPGCNYPSPERLTGYWHSADLKERARAEDCDDYYSPQDAWSPSTNIAAAWEVVEKLCAEKRDGRGWFNLSYANGKFEASFETGAYDEPIRKVRGSSAPHAISLASLRAVGHEL